MRIIFVPQYPVPNRYPEWWFWRFPEEFRKAGFDVITLGEKYIQVMENERGLSNMFSPINMSIELETEQIREYMDLELRDDDILFLSDISFPGIFCSTLYHKKPKKCFAFCHATSMNRMDYFSNVRASKFPVESAHAGFFDKVFVGSNYHKDKLRWNNIFVSYLPNPDYLQTFKNEEKIYNIVSVSRPSLQKVDNYLEERVEQEFEIKIKRKETTAFEEYYRFLGQSKVMLITAFEDTFGYQIVDAINNNCIPIARNRFAYPELLPREYLYSSDNELMNVLNNALKGKLQVPTLICEEQIKNFFNVITGEML